MESSGSWMRTLKVTFWKSMKLMGSWEVLNRCLGGRPGFPFRNEHVEGGFSTHDDNLLTCLNQDTEYASIPDSNNIDDIPSNLLNCSTAY